MRVRALKVLAGPSGVRQPGQVFEVSDDEGRALIAAQAAQSVGQPAPVIETAVEAPAPENAAERTGKPEPVKPEPPKKAKAKRKKKGK